MGVCGSMRMRDDCCSAKNSMKRRLFSVNYIYIYIYIYII